MSYVSGRAFRDDAGSLFTEHRPGYFRREGAPVSRATEHSLDRLDLPSRMMVSHGVLTIEEETEFSDLIEGKIDM